MWLLHLMPDWIIQFVVRSVLSVGLIGTLLTFVFLNHILRWWPAAALYYRGAQIVSLILLVAGVYFEGGYSTEQIWWAEVKALEEKAEKAERESERTNEELRKKLAARQIQIKTEIETITEYIDREVKVHDGECRIPQSFVKAHNDSIGGNKP